MDGKALSSKIYYIIATLVIVGGVFLTGMALGKLQEKDSIQSRIEAVEFVRKKNDAKVKALTPAERCMLIGGSMRNTGHCE